MKLRALALLLVGTTVVAQESALISFKIKDQFDRVHTDVEYRGNVLVIIGGDKGGAEFSDQWKRAIGESLSDELAFDEVKFLRYADMRGVPFFLKGMIKGKFPREKEFWILLDWKGHIAKAYEFQSDATNVVIFDRDGQLRHHAYGRAPDEGNVSAIADVISGLMAY